MSMIAQSLERNRVMAEINPTKYTYLKKYGLMLDDRGVVIGRAIPQRFSALADVCEKLRLDVPCTVNVIGG